MRGVAMVLILTIVVVIVAANGSRAQPLTAATSVAFTQCKIGPECPAIVGRSVPEILDNEVGGAAPSTSGSRDTLRDALFVAAVVLAYQQLTEIWQCLWGHRAIATSITSIDPEVFDPAR